MQIHSSNSKDKLLEQAAVDLENKIIENQKVNSTCHLAVCGGRSVVPIFQKLSHSENITWQSLHLWMADERLLPVGHQDRNDELLLDHLIEGLAANAKFPIENFHQVKAEQSPELEAEIYSKELLQHGGEIQVFLLSLGEDGHIASLFPGKESLKSDAIFLAESHSPKDPPLRISAGPETVKKAKAIVALGIGEGKHASIKKMFEEKTPVDEIPAKLLYQVQDASFYTDFPLT